MNKCPKSSQSCQTGDYQIKEFSKQSDEPEFYQIKWYSGIMFSYYLFRYQLKYKYYLKPFYRLWFFYIKPEIRKLLEYKEN